MNFRLLILLAATLSVPSLMDAQSQSKTDSSDLELLKKTKSGLQVKVLPIIGFNSDLGFQFGGFGEFHCYGKNPSYYPVYKHKFNIQASYYTKGQALIHGEYDSSFLIPGVRLSACATYTIDPLYSFYGFNGLMTRYDSDLDRKGKNAVYSMNRKMLRILSSLQGRVNGHLSWVGGLSFWHYDIADIDFGDYDTNNTLYHRYVSEGTILSSEASGGNVLEFKTGLSYDSRDFETSPRNGISAEIYLNGAPGLFGNAYLGLCAHYRQYLTPWSDRITFAWHIAWQGRLAGRLPFYMLSNIYSLTVRESYNKGLGGQNTIRGVISGRLLGNGYAWCNLETRFRLYKTRFAGEDFSFGVNPFFDAGLITEGYASDRIDGYDDSLTKAVHCAAGLGFKFGIGANYIASVEIAKAFRSQDGPYSLALAVNYIF